MRWLQLSNSVKPAPQAAAALYFATWGVLTTAWATLGGWLGGGIAWHLAAMWLLVGNALVYFAYGLAGRHFMRSFLPLSPRAVLRDLGFGTLTGVPYPAEAAGILRIPEKWSKQSSASLAMSATNERSIFSTSIGNLRRYEKLE